MEITPGELRGETAILDVEGESAPGLPALYVLRLGEEADSWRFDQSAMVGIL